MVKLPEWKYLKYNIQQKFAEMTARKGYSRKSYKGDSFMQKVSDFRMLVLTNPILRICVSLLCLVLIVALVRVAFFSGDKDEIIDPDIAWFYDLNTGELFTADKTLLPPIETDSGPLEDGSDAGVIANVLTYDPTGEDPQMQFIGYLEKLSGQGKVVWTNAFETNTQTHMEWHTGRLIKRVDDEDWVEASSPKGLYIRKIVFKPNQQGVIPLYVVPK